MRTIHFDLNLQNVHVLYDHLAYYVTTDLEYSPWFRWPIWV